MPGVVRARRLIRRRGGDDQGDLAEVVGQATGHLVGPRQPYLHPRRLFRLQGSASAGADLLGERDARDQRDTEPVEPGVADLDR